MISIERPVGKEKFYACINIDSNKSWKFEFIPQGWYPLQGSYKADAYFIPDVEWPTLVITQRGILVPCKKPKREMSG